MRTGLWLLAVCTLGSAPLAAQAVHRVRLQGGAGGVEYRFDPGRVNARAGDVVEFVVAAGGPYQLGFEAADLTPDARRVLVAALPELDPELRGPVLAGPGSRFRLTVPALPAGRYRFRSIPHVAYRMEGVLIVR